MSPKILKVSHGNTVPPLTSSTLTHGGQFSELVFFSMSILDSFQLSNKSQTMVRWNLYQIDRD